MASCENFSPQTISRLQREIGAMARSSPEGCTFVPSEDDDITEILCDLGGPVGTPYEGGVFRVRLILSSDYPSSPPKGFFLTRIYHPNVGPTGDICVNTLKKDWTQSVTISHIFQVIRCLLIIPFPESSLNDEAGKLFMESYDEFEQRARLMTVVHATKKSSPKKACSSHLTRKTHEKSAETNENKGILKDQNVQISSIEKPKENKHALKAKEPKKKAIRRL